MLMAAYPLPYVVATPRSNCYRRNTVPTGPCLSCKYSTLKNGIVTVQLVDFTAARKVDTSFKQGSGAPEEYIKQIDRIVNVTFPDSSRIRYLGRNVWRARLKPITFFTITATPFCDLKVFHKEDSVHLHSNKLVLDFTCIPHQYTDLDLKFCLQGELLVHQKPSSVAGNEQSPRFLGWVKIGLNVDLPFPFSLMPEAIVVPVGNDILDRILGAMEGALVSRISKDYNTWCQKLSNQQHTTIARPSFP